MVVGGGNTAIDVAREALRLGATTTTVVYRRSEAEMPAYPHEVAEARAEGIRFQFLTDPVRIVGSERVEAVVCRRMRLGEPDASGRRRPEPIPESELTLRADTVVKAIGQQPRHELADWISDLELAQDGTVRVDPATSRTSRAKVFAGGERRGRHERGGSGARVEAGGARDPRVAAMNGLTEIRWHARAGQGAKTASQILALALLRSGRFVQAFPKYGPERRGAPLAPLHPQRRPADPPARRSRASGRGRRARTVARGRGGRDRGPR